MSNFTTDETFQLTEIAAMPRGMTLAEAEHYLMTDELPLDDPFRDISHTLTPEERQAQEDEARAHEEFDTDGLSPAEVIAFLSGERAITAAVHAGIFKHKNVDDDNGYDSNQPRDAHGQWTRVGATALAERITNAVHGAAALKSPTLMLTSEDDPNHPALATYASHQYTLINNALRYAKTSDKGVSGLKPDLRNVINEIDDEMSKSTLKDDIVVYRGIKTPENAFGAAWNDQPGSMVGVEYRDPHYSSTSASANIAMDFSEIIRSKYEQDRKGRISGVKRTRTSGVQLRILALKGSHAVGLALHGEGEVLLPRDTHFRIVGDHVVDGDRLLDVEVVSG
jgi:hypothetical protein